MARYFFHLHECGVVTPDPEGQEIETLDAVRQAAVRDARSIVCEEAKEGAVCLSCYIDVTDAAGAPVLRVLFKDAVAFTGLGSA